jgi:hypothetical protein
MLQQGLSEKKLLFEITKSADDSGREDTNFIGRGFKGKRAGQI